MTIAQTEKMDPCPQPPEFVGCRRSLRVPSGETLIDLALIKMEQGTDPNFHVWKCFSCLFSLCAGSSVHAFDFLPPSISIFPRTWQKPRVVLQVPPSFLNLHPVCHGHGVRRSHFHPAQSQADPLSEW